MTNCHALKMTSRDGKKRLTDVANTEQLLRLVQSVPSKKAEPFKRMDATGDGSLCRGGADFYDLFYLTKTPGTYSMRCVDKKMILTVTEEDGECIIKYDGKWYRDFADFLAKAEFDGQRVTSIYDEFYV